MIFALLILAAAQDAQPSIDGLWKNPAGSVIIAIEPCGSTLCGNVKWASAKAKADAAKGTNQLVGSNLLTNLKPRGEDVVRPIVRARPQDPRECQDPASRSRATESVRLRNARSSVQSAGLGKDERAASSR